ncbi:hypothetical protein [Curtobacterium flaccumfaciens]|uniref:hypothetical protein n=1 Tax=Curtobacterium flaccumfaciens TaxID=2035 RepID=UPI00136746FC|nr:hypothetical protein [Curtobacterium flaccumfaciens]MBT1665416.1 hypothetical protein [Curtobacterium flaccumfaciens pv. flaccumfaciens]QHN62747.1 hypothetical protein GBG65_19700 [Curtobacterium flaccumfaciens pv. flaccumfaciens]
MRSMLHAPRTRKRSIAAATLGALALIGSLLVATPAQALNDTGTGGVFVPATGRILDTAKGTGGFSTPMEAGKYRTIKVAGLAGLPDDGSVGAVSLNATVGASTGAGTLFGRPNADTGRATMLIYNGVSGEYTSNTATVAVDTDGTIQVMTETASRLILDVQGYYTANTDGTAAGGFVSVAKRIVDTRSGLGAPKAALAPGKSVDVQITGANGIPSGASGVVVSLIAINGTDADGYFTPYATGATRPANSLHYAPSESTSIQAQVPLSADGKITIANSSTTANLLVDLQGYFTAAGKGGAVFTPAYGRAYDSRATGNTALAENETRSIQIAGTAGVPVMGSGITAVVLTLIVAHGGSNGYADAWADGTTKPNTSAINFQTNEIQTNTITVPLGANGKISLRNAAKATNYVIDVQGWYTNPQVPTISCPAYASGSWTTAIPDTAIPCTVTAPIAAETDDAVAITLDGEDLDLVNMSSTAATVTDVEVAAVQGSHTLKARLTSGSRGDSALAATYQFGLGDWASKQIVPSIADGDTVPMSPDLAVTVSGNDELPQDGVITYRVYELGSTDPKITSDALSPDTPFSLPQGELQPNTPYTWNATLAGRSGASQTMQTVSSRSWAFTTNDTDNVEDAKDACAAKLEAMTESDEYDSATASSEQLGYACYGDTAEIASEGDETSAPTTTAKSRVATQASSSPRMHYVYNGTTKRMVSVAGLTDEEAESAVASIQPDESATPAAGPSRVSRKAGKPGLSGVHEKINSQYREVLGVTVTYGEQDPQGRPITAYVLKNTVTFSLGKLTTADYSYSWTSLSNRLTSPSLEIRSYQRAIPPIRIDTVFSGQGKGASMVYRTSYTQKGTVLLNKGRYQYNFDLRQITINDMRKGQWHAGSDWFAMVTGKRFQCYKTVGCKFPNGKEAP